jgi:hypothetical protein
LERGVFSREITDFHHETTDFRTATTDRATAATADFKVQETTGTSAVAETESFNREKADFKEKTESFNRETNVFNRGDVSFPKEKVLSRGNKTRDHASYRICK